MSKSRLGGPGALSSRARGSTLLLVLAALLLSLLLGLTYMEVVRQDRKATRNLLNQGDLDVVVQSVIDLAVNRIVSDLGIEQTTNNFFTAPDADSGGAAVEAYDYPGDVDRWLASSVPELVGTAAVWDQITLLDINQGFFIGNSATPDATRQAVAEDAVPTATGFYDRNLDTGTAVARLADADGDGITDSKPQRAPIASLRGVDYFMWVRIEDNSAKLNANVALSQVDAGGLYDATADAPRWWNPSELNLGGFVYGFSNANGYAPLTTMGQLTNFINIRLGNPNPTLLPATSPRVPWRDPTNAYLERRHYWKFGASQYDDYYNGVVPAPPAAPGYADAIVNDNEIRLRRRGGLSTNDTPPGPIELAGLPMLLRTGAGEASFRDYLDAPGGPPAASTPGNAGDVINYFTSNPRLHLTTLSGHSIFRKGLAGDPVGRALKPDLNRFVTTSNVGELSLEIQKILGLLELGAFVPPTALETGLSVTFQPATLAAYADQLAANIVDYIDDDTTQNRFTLHNGRYGMESVPFISEVYIQHAYQATAVVPAGGPLPRTVTWTRQTPGFAIEIRNPFPQPVRTNDISVTFRIPAPVNVLLSSLPGVPNPLPSGQAILLYQNSAGNSPDNEMLGMGNASDPSVIPVPMNLPLLVQPIVNNGSAFAIEMRGLDNLGGNVVYQRVTSPLVYRPLTHVQTPVLPINAPAMFSFGYTQLHTIGNGNGLNMLTVQDSAPLVPPAAPVPVFRRREYLARPTAGAPLPKDNPDATPWLPIQGPIRTRLPALANLGQSNKADGPNDILPANEAQFLFNGTGEMKEVGEMALIAMFGPTPVNDYPAPDTGTIPVVWNNKRNMDGLFLNLAGPAIPPGQLRHEQLLLDHFTTLSPAEDGLDNDGQGDADNIPAGLTVTNEQFIPGTINLNTAPLSVLQTALPLARFVDDISIVGNTVVTGPNGVHDFIDYLEAYRLGTYRPAAGQRAQVGIASLGELIHIPAYGNNTVDDSDPVGGVRVDFHPHDVNGNAVGGADGIADDVEEQTLFMRQLGQVGSVRSDVFTVYALVRGYRGQMLESQQRVCVVVDRSRFVARGQGGQVIRVRFEH